MKTPAAWLRSAKRREPGIYAYRTWRHHRPTKTEWGYVGKSRHLAARDRQHKGTDLRYKTPAKPWADLIVNRYVIRLPWWLGWDWITLSLETVAILALRPRYNDQKNPRPGKVRSREQKAQRYERDHRTAGYTARVQVQRFLDITVRLIGVIIILVGIGGYLWIN